MKKFSCCWKSSCQPRKQRKYRYNAPLHLRQRFVAAHLSEELRKKHGLRSVALRAGDSVKVMRGSFSGKTLKVERVDLRKCRVFLSSADVVRRDGSKVLVPFVASKLLVQALNLDDKRRKLGSVVKK